MSDRLHCPGCGIPTIEGGLDTTEEELYCNRCVEELERNMSTNKPAGGAQFTPGPWHLEHDVDGIPLTIIGSDGSAIGTVETWNDCTEGNRLVLTAAPAMYEALAKLRLEAIHYRNTGVGKQFLNEAIAQAEQAINQVWGEGNHDTKREG